MKMTKRMVAISSAYLRGETTESLGREWGVGRNRIRQIVRKSLHMIGADFTTVLKARAKADDYIPVMEMEESVRGMSREQRDEIYKNYPL